MTSEMSVFEWAIVGFIIVSILWHVWRGGAANPESTGTLGRKLGSLSNDVAALSGRVDNVAEEIANLERESVRTGDIARLEAKIDGRAVLADRVWHSVERIERFLIEKGLGK